MLPFCLHGLLWMLAHVGLRRLDWLSIQGAVVSSVGASHYCQGLIGALI